MRKHTLERNEAHGCTLPGEHTTAMCEPLAETEPLTLEELDKLPPSIEEEEDAPEARRPDGLDTN